MAYLYIIGTVVFTVYGQIVLKWRIGKYGALPEFMPQKILFLLNLLLDPFIFSGFLSAFIASLFWMSAMTKFEISFAYPFMSLSYVLVLIMSGIFFHESITMYKVAGMTLIVAGIFVSSR